MIAEDYPRFTEFSDLAPRPDRLNERHEAIIAANRDIIAGARVLDLASHDGRFSFAALKAGAAHVTAVEARQSLVDQGREIFDFYGQDPETYRFVCGDVFDVLARERFEVDVVLCLGYLYHTYRHTELMYRLHELDPRHLVVDTMVTPDTQPTLAVMLEPSVHNIRGAAQDAYAVDRVLALRPSVPALQQLLGAYGFEIESGYDWRSRLADRSTTGLEGYAQGRRVTLRCRSVEAARAAGWEAVAPLTFASDPSGRWWRQRIGTTLARITRSEPSRGGSTG